ncbi:MAG TPA: tetratricopeptide repeat protein, partial [Calditrichaeota bacterium]|nr:tetratricopeptide repeat protein [Calditrichota bacterium]
MKKTLFSLLSILVLSVLLTSCRPPELEGAFVEYKQGRIDNALQLAKEATEKYPNNSEAWFLYGEIQGQKENYQEMVNAFDKSLAIDKNFETKIKQAKNYFFQSEFNKGVNNYNAYIKQEDRNSDQAKELLKKSLKSFQNANIIEEDYKATSLIGFGHVLLGEKDEAIKYYKRCTEIKPDTSDGWIALGNFYMVEQKYAEAIPPLEKALQIDPNNTEAVSLLSQAYDLTGNQDKAIELYEKAMALQPDEKAFPFNLGLIFYKATT